MTPPTSTDHGNAWTRSAIAPAAAALATLCAATALTGVIDGWAWLGHSTLAVVLVAAVGLVLRSLRVPTFGVGMAQLAVLLLLVTTMYTSSGILGIIPGPAAWHELGDVLTAAGETIRTGLPPVEPNAAILCLATIGIGMIAVVVDALAVAIAAPAASGLMLLCVYAIPASLADEMLPWWTFVLGAMAFAVLIAVDGSHRHRMWRGRRSPVPATPAAATTPTIVVALAVAGGVVAGATVTGIGTVGQLPFDDDRQPSFAGGLGLRPFTELRGLLNEQGDTEVFRVRGLDDERRLLRAFTLDTFVADEGWRLPQRMPHGVDASQRPLPEADGDDGQEPANISINPVNWRDVWLPTYGLVREIRGIDADTWFYDSGSGSVYRENAARPPSYSMRTSLAEPDADDLREIDASTAARQLPDTYTDLPEMDQRVENLTRNIVRGESTDFDKAAALWNYFINDGDFTYDTRTAAAVDDDALVDFLLHGKRGYCAQFASAMAVMLRSEGIPARVAIGFTQGSQERDYRSISTKDAHAWVEAYFGPDEGWVTFDPTPLDGGRGFVPPYLEDDGTSDSESDDAAAGAEPSAEPEQQPEPEADDTTDPEDAVDTDAMLATAPGWARWSALALLLVTGGMTGGAVLVSRRSSDMRATPEAGQQRHRLSVARRWLPLATAAGWLLSIGLCGWMVSWWLALALLIVASVAVGPALLREFHRGRRLHAITMSHQNAPYAAWQELLDECADRGTYIEEAETVRQTARQLATKYDLDQEGTQHLSTVVRLLERSWYSPNADVAVEFAPAFENLRTSLRRSSPLSWRARLLPTSVLRRRRRA